FQRCSHIPPQLSAAKRRDPQTIGLFTGLGFHLLIKVNKPETRLALMIYPLHSYRRNPGLISLTFK
ncbi:MAG: hypothetical protein ACREAM_28695, partial [Blastocatellia bacterium]